MLLEKCRRGANEEPQANELHTIGGTLLVECLSRLAELIKRKLAPLSLTITLARVLTDYCLSLYVSWEKPSLAASPKAPGYTRKQYRRRRRFLVLGTEVKSWIH